ncbi:MAG: alpha/beta hydrolase [Promethearchaeota archaeon]|jgi:acetyl esterase/lipase
MPVVDIAKIKRPEILKIIDERNDSLSEINDAFFNAHDIPMPEFKPIWKKISDLNTRWLSGEDVKGALTIEEIAMQVKYIRFTLEYPANKSQEENPISKDVKLEPIDANGVPGEWQTVPDANKERVLLYIHGGGHIMSSINTHREFTVMLGRKTNMRVLSLDYRLAPENPHPAALEDCVNAYKWLLSNGIKPKNIIICGDSAGGYYTLLTLLKLRDSGEKLPAGGICFSPSTDMAQTGESVINNSSTDVILGNLGYIWWVHSHLVDIDPFNPAVSPLYADLKGLPPLLIQVSTSEMLYDDSKRFFEKAKQASVDITMQTWENTLHVFQRYPQLPETKEALEKVADFIMKIVH